MSDFKGHFKGGLVAAGIFLILAIIAQILFHPLAWIEIPLLLAVCLFGAFWPDADIGSKSQQVIYIIFIIIDVVLIFGLKYYREAAILGLFTMLPAIGKHRGWTHNPLWALAVGLPFLIPPAVIGNQFLIDIDAHLARGLLFVGIPYYIAFLAGVMSHLALDNLAFFKRMRSKAKKLPAKPETKLDKFLNSVLSLKSRFLPGKEPDPESRENSETDSKSTRKKGEANSSKTAGGTRSKTRGEGSKTGTGKGTSKTNTGKSRKT